MPADDILPYFAGSVTPAKLASLKPLWKISMQALLKTATDYGAITERRARDIWMQFGKAGYRRREPPHLDVPIEEPRVFQEIINFHTTRLGFSSGDLARVVNLSEAEVRAAYLGKPGATLRAVKDSPGTFRASSSTS